jgi:hypothetical protein
MKNIVICVEFYGAFYYGYSQQTEIIKYLSNQGNKMRRKFNPQINWERLSDFYINVFHCRVNHPERNLSGDWLDKCKSRMVSVVFVELKSSISSHFSNSIGFPSLKISLIAKPDLLYSHASLCPRRAWG